MWAVDGQLHIFSIWDKYNCPNKCPNGKVPVRETKGNKSEIKKSEIKKSSCPLGILSVLVVGISILISYRRSLCYSLRNLEQDI